MAKLFPISTRALVLATLLFGGGCASTAEQDALSSQLSELQRQILQLQTGTITKEEFAEFRGSLTGTLEQLVVAAADGATNREQSSRDQERITSALENSLVILRQLRKQVEAIAVRIEELEAALPRPAAPGLAPDQSQLYDRSYNALLRGDCELAITGFRSYVDSFTSSEQADNAQYWIGECYFSQGKHRDAIREFNQLQERFPSSERLPSALLRSSQAWNELGERDRARTALQAVLQRYPSSDEAVLAQQRLLALGSG